MKKEMDGFHRHKRIAIFLQISNSLKYFCYSPIPIHKTLPSAWTLLTALHYSPQPEALYEILFKNK